MPLTAAAIQAAKPREKAYKLFDQGGLFLLVHPNGGRYWRLKYRMHGREKLLALGTFPDVSLAKARSRRDDARKLIADKTDPAVVKQTDKAASTETFKAVALEWLAKQKLAAATIEKAKWTFEQLLFPELGDKPIRHIKAPELLAALRNLEARGRSRRRIERSSVRVRYSGTRLPPDAPTMTRLPIYGAHSHRWRLSIARRLRTRSESANCYGR